MEAGSILTFKGALRAVREEIAGHKTEVGRALQGEVVGCGHAVGEVEGLELMG